MRTLVRYGLVALVAAGLATAALAQAPSGKAGSPAAKKAPGAPAAKAGAPAPSPDEGLATVNGEPITRGEVVEFLSQYPQPANLSEDQVYDTAVNFLINTKLLTQFLARQKVAVSDKEIDDTVTAIDKDLRTRSQTLATQMAETGTSMAELRDRVRRRLQWKNYVMQRATDAELRKFADENKDTLNGAQVRASHILLMVDSSAPAAEKEKVRQKLLSIKKDIESGKITFADAANKYSEDPINVQSKAGGDLNYFPRKGQFIEEFAAKAFSMKKGEISDPIETRFGYHLIQVTDRMEGRPFDFTQQREEVLNLYASNLQEQIIAEARKAAKIDIKPVPKDLFQAPPGAETAGGQPAQPKSTANAPKSSAPR